MGFSVNFQASTGNKLRENKDGNVNLMLNIPLLSKQIHSEYLNIFFHNSLAGWIRYLMSYIINLKNYNIILFYLQIEGAPEIFPRQKSKHER